MAFVHVTEATTRSVRLRQILFLGDEKQRKKATLQETKADQMF